MTPAARANEDDAAKMHPVSDVFILGAGFSKTVDSRMPVLDDLGTRLAEHVTAYSPYAESLAPHIISQLREGSIPTGNVETWLSSLAESQPFLDEVEATSNYALFLDLTRSLVNIIDSSQRDAIADAPAWLHRLIRLWHERRPTIITFNYDTIIEQVIPQLDIPESHGNLQKAIANHLPPAIPTGPRWFPDSEERPTFRLLKLHGSLDWYWLPTDTTGDTIRQLPADDPPDAISRAALAGKERFIIPPLSAKSRQYSLGIVRHLWQQARLALSNASRLILVGYSLPLTDLSTTAMLTDALRARPAIWLVDKAPSPVQQRLEWLRLRVAEPVIVNQDVGGEFVDRYEEEYCQEMTSRVAHQLERYSAIPDGAPIIVLLTRSTHLVVSRIEETSSALILHTDELHPPSGRPPATLPAGYSQAAQFKKLLESAQSTPRPIVVKSPDDDGIRMVIGTVDPKNVTGTRAVESWLALSAQSKPSRWFG